MSTETIYFARQSDKYSNLHCVKLDLIYCCSKRNPGPSNIFLQDECTRKGSLQAIEISMDKNQVLNSEATLIDKSSGRQRPKKSSVCSFASSLDSRKVPPPVHQAERRKKISLCTSSSYDAQQTSLEWEEAPPGLGRPRKLSLCLLPSNSQAIVMASPKVSMYRVFLDAIAHASISLFKVVSDPAQWLIYRFFLQLFSRLWVVQLAKWASSSENRMSLKNEINQKFCQRLGYICHFWYVDDLHSCLNHALQAFGAAEQGQQSTEAKQFSKKWADS